MSLLDNNGLSYLWGKIKSYVGGQLPSDFTGATTASAGAHGLVPAPTTTDTEKFLRGDGSWGDGGKPMVVLSYGSSTWSDFINAYKNNIIVYCRASSNSNPATGAQNRMAFMAYVNDSTNPTNVEFQYYRSVNSHSATQQGDQVYVYKLDKTAGWTVTVRESYTKIIGGTNTTTSYSGGALTINATDTDTWRNISINGVEKLGTAKTTGSVGFINGLNTTVTYNDTNRTIQIDTEGGGSSTDTNVTQTESTDNDAYEVLVSGTASTATTTEGVNKSKGFRYNPSIYAVMEGSGTYAKGHYSHAEGYRTTAEGESSHAEGIGSEANGDYSHAEGYQTLASTVCTHAEGYGTCAKGNYSHSEGYGSVAVANYSHAEGYYTTTHGGLGSHSEGYCTKATGDGSHAEGYYTKATNSYGHAEGSNTYAQGDYSHAEGENTIAKGVTTHAEGFGTLAQGAYSHVEGNNTYADNWGSHAEGYYTTASGMISHVQGYYNKTTHRSQHVFGEYNALDASTAVATERGTYVEIVGNGTNATTGRSNARTLDWNGNEVLSGKLTVGTAPTNDMDVATKKYVDDAVTAAIAQVLAAQY